MPGIDRGQEVPKGLIQTHLEEVDLPLRPVEGREMGVRRKSEARVTIPIPSREYLVLDDGKLFFEGV